MNAFPQGFLWGTATAAHQVEGNNTNSDFWVLEHAPYTIFKEPSGDACDHYRLYREDIHILKDLGFNAYRFSIEWARVEPEDGVFSKAALYHYRDVLETCNELDITPLVTFHHFTSPRWLMKHGGWENHNTPRRFAAYSKVVMEELGEWIPYVCTINEANIGIILRQMNVVPPPVGMGAHNDNPWTLWMQACARELNTAPDKVKNFLFSPTEAALAVVREAHARAAEAIKTVRPETQVGITLALQDYQAQPGGEALADAMWAETFEAFMPACQADDFIGVQNYSRVRLGPQGMLPNEEGVEATQMGYEYYPEALEHVIRRAAAAGKPLIVTENGLSTEDDSRRVEFIRRALEGVQRCLADGLDVRGYTYWSALDNFEWVSGYGPKFGLIGVDRSTQERTVKESARYLGQIAMRNGLG